MGRRGQRQDGGCAGRKISGSSKIPGRSQRRTLSLFRGQEFRGAEHPFRNFPRRFHQYHRQRRRARPRHFPRRMRQSGGYGHRSGPKAPHLQESPSDPSHPPPARCRPGGRGRQGKDRFHTQGHRTHLHRQNGPTRPQGGRHPRPRLRRQVRTLEGAPRAPAERPRL